MRTTLTLGKKAPKSNVGAKNNKPQPKDKDKQAFEDCGFIMEYLYKRGIKPKWKRPLSKGLYKELRELLATELISSKRLNNAIKHHVKSPGYLLLMRTGAQRYNLYGKPDGRVTEQESKHALGELYEHHAGLMRDRRKRRNKKITPTRKTHVKKQGEHRKI